MNKIFKLLLIYFVLLKTSIASENHLDDRVKIYTNETEMTKTIFNIIEFASSKSKIPIYLKVGDFQFIENSLEKEKVDILITQNYKIIEDLIKQNLVSKKLASEFAFDKLTFIPLNSLNNSSIFFKTSPLDGDIFEEGQIAIPSKFLQSSNLCNTIQRQIENDEKFYSKIIIKISIAKKCELPYQGSFNDMYNVYYIAVINGHNLIKSEEIFNIITKSIEVKKIIQKNGFGI